MYIIIHIYIVIDAFKHSYVYASISPCVFIHICQRVDVCIMYTHTSTQSGYHKKMVCQQKSLQHYEFPKCNNCILSVQDKHLNTINAVASCFRARKTSTYHKTHLSLPGPVVSGVSFFCCDLHAWHTFSDMLTTHDYGVGSFELPHFWAPRYLRDEFHVTDHTKVDCWHFRYMKRVSPSVPESCQRPHGERSNKNLT